MRKRRDYGNLKPAAERVLAVLRDVQKKPSGFTVVEAVEMFEREAGLPSDLSEVVVRRYRKAVTADFLGFGLYERFLVYLRKDIDRLKTGSGEVIALRNFVWTPNGNGRQGHFWQRGNVPQNVVEEVLDDREARRNAGGSMIKYLTVAKPLLAVLGPHAKLGDVEDAVLAAL